MAGFKKWLDELFGTEVDVNDIDEESFDTLLEMFEEVRA